MAFLLNSGTLRTRFPILRWWVAETQNGDTAIEEGLIGGESSSWGNVEERGEGEKRGSGRKSSPEQEIISENWKMQN